MIPALQLNTNWFVFKCNSGASCTSSVHQGRRKFAKSGGAIISERKYFYGKKLTSYGVPLK